MRGFIFKYFFSVVAIILFYLGDVYMNLTAYNLQLYDKKFFFSVTNIIYLSLHLG